MHTSGRTLIVSMSDVKELLAMDDCVRGQEDVFKRNGHGTAWNGPNAWVGPDRAVMTYPATGKMMCGGVEPDWWGMKLLSTREGSPSDRARMQLLALFNAETLLPVAVLEANYLGHMRTGAAAAVATRSLARSDARVIGVLGTGATARFGLWAHGAMGWPADKVQVFSRSSERRYSYAKEMSALTGYEVEPLGDPESLISQAEILITGTSSYQAAFAADWVQPGTHINAMGQRQEIPAGLFARSRNIADEIPIATTDGKLAVAMGVGAITHKDVHASLGEVMTGKESGRSSAADITIFDSSGLAIQDIAAGVRVWELARQEGRGKPVEFEHDGLLW